MRRTHNKHDARSVANRLGSEPNRGQFICAREAIKRFLEQGVSPASKAQGKIICMSSVHEVIPWAGHVNYAASKGGIMLMMKSLAQEVAEKKIRVNGIAPGAIKTKINEDVWSDPERAKELLKLIPYGRIGEPEDVAKADLDSAGRDVNADIRLSLKMRTRTPKKSSSV